MIRVKFRRHNGVLLRVTIPEGSRSPYWTPENRSRWGVYKYTPLHTARMRRWRRRIRRNGT